MKAQMDFARGPDKTGGIVRLGLVTMLKAGGDDPAYIDREWINGLNANRKPDREALAMAFTTIANAHGATVERRDIEPNPGFRGCSIDLTISCGGVGAVVDFSNLYGGTHSLISWYTDYSVKLSERRGAMLFSQRFALDVGDGNTLRGGGLHNKATTCCATWEGLAISFDKGLRKAARGEAFEPSAT